MKQEEYKKHKNNNNNPAQKGTQARDAKIKFL